MDSENKKNLQSDNWRFMQLNKSLSSKKHPFHKFSTGNYKVLRDDPSERGVNIREAFMKFHGEHYSANRMKLAVLGKESLDELESWVVELFSEVKNKALPRLRWDEAIYGADEVGTQIFTKPVMDQRNLDIYFPYPDEEPDWESKPSKYVSHLIGHEGPGSILAYLKAKGWANGLSAGDTHVCPGAGIFMLQVRLTEEGLKQYKEIVKIVFHYIAMVKENGPQKWIVEEEMKLSDIDFKFQQKAPASRTVSHYSGTMQHPFLPRDKLLSGQRAVLKFDHEAIKRGLAHLVPDNFRLVLISKELPVETDKKEKWYGTEYKYEKIPEDFMREVKKAAKAPSSERPSELHLPAKNEFIAQRLDVEKKEVDEPALEPKLIRNEVNVRTWYKKDDQFWVPKANVNIYLRSPLVNLTPLTAVMTQLYRELVRDSLEEYAYAAELAGLNYDIMNHGQGLDVELSGYNDKMSVLLEKVLVSMRDLEIKQERFDIIKERLNRGFKNFDYVEPFRQIGSYSRWLTSQRSWVNHELVAELALITADDVRAFFPQLLKQMHIELLVHGNLYKEDALRMTDLTQATLKPRHLPPSQWTSRRTVELPAGSDYRYEHTLANPDNVNHCIEYTVFAGNNHDRPQRAKLLLLADLTSEPCFDQLRTKEQLGYVVISGPIINVSSMAWRVIIQSEKDCGYLEKRIDLFLQGYEAALKDMPEEEFQAHKIGVINKRLERLKNLNSETARFWHHVTSEVMDFELGKFTSFATVVLDCITDRFRSTPRCREH